MGLGAAVGSATDVGTWGLAARRRRSQLPSGSTAQTSTRRTGGLASSIATAAASTVVSANPDQTWSSAQPEYGVAKAPFTKKPWNR